MWKPESADIILLTQSSHNSGSSDLAGTASPSYSTHREVLWYKPWMDTLLDWNTSGLIISTTYQW